MKTLQRIYVSTILLVPPGLILSGIFLLARVMQGQCRAVVTIFESQECNPVASAGSIPHDQVIISAMCIVPFYYIDTSIVMCPHDPSFSTYAAPCDTRPHLLSHLSQT